MQKTPKSGKPKGFDASLEGRENFLYITTGNSLGKSLGKSLGAVEKQNLPRCLTLILVVRSQ